MSVPVSWFLNRNLKDFGYPEIVDELKRHNCTLIPSFDGALERIRSSLGKHARSRVAASGPAKFLFLSHRSLPLEELREKPPESPGQDAGD